MASNVSGVDSGIGGSGCVDGEKTNKGLSFEGLRRYIICLLIECQRNGLSQT